LCNTYQCIVIDLYGFKKPIVMKNKYKEGSAVHAIANPGQKLIIRRYVDRVYYCKIAENLTAKELVFFEWELASDSIKE
jgi:hypothetical protein